jgi:hypothetical protein
MRHRRVIFSVLLTFSFFVTDVSPSYWRAQKSWHMNWREMIQRSCHLMEVILSYESFVFIPMLVLLRSFMVMTSCDHIVEHEKHDYHRAQDYVYNIYHFLYQVKLSHVLGNRSLFQLTHMFLDHLSPIRLEIPLYNMQIFLKSPSCLPFFYYSNLLEY